MRALAKKNDAEKRSWVPFETTGKKENFQLFFFHFSPKNLFWEKNKICANETSHNFFVFPSLFLLFYYVLPF